MEAIIASIILLVFGSVMVGVFALFPAGRQALDVLFGEVFRGMRRKRNAPMPDPRQMLREMRAREMQNWDNEFRALMGLGPLRRDDHCTRLK